jgi:Putative MetA-pathway of phenol degradation
MTEPFQRRGFCLVQRVFALLAFCLLSALWTSSTHAQGGPPMITDDPGTPGDGHWEINIAALTDHSSDVNTHELPLLDLNFGVGDRIQLKYEVPLVTARQDSNRVTGLGNSLAGVKWRFCDAGEESWQISTYPQVEFNYPASSSPRRGLAEPAVAYFLPLELTRTYATFDINFEVGRWARSRGQFDTWIGGVVIGHHFGDAFELIAELHEETTTDWSRDELILNLGARWNLSERYSLLFSAGRDLHNSLQPENTLLTYLGLQMRL